MARARFSLKVCFATLLCATWVVYEPWPSDRIEFDTQQRSELLLTIGQSFTGLVFLLNMESAWWEAAAMLILFVAQFVLPHAPIGFVRFMIWRAKHNAFASFLATWRVHVSA